MLSTYDVFVSAVVVAEIEATQDPDRRRDLLEAVRSYPVLPFAARAEQLAEQYREYVAMPLEDALHVAIATVEGMDYLATWNMRHLAKENTRRIVDNVNFLARLPAIFIVTPQDLLD